MDKPLSSKAKRDHPLAIFIVFGAAGIAFLFPTFILPFRGIYAARNWDATPCRILDSSVRRHYGRKGGSTYSVHIDYSYTVKGRTYTGDRYKFMSGSSSGYAGKQEIVNRYPAGSRAVCYVNPAHPDDAVIERGFTQDMGIAIVPLLFIGACAWPLYSSVRLAKRSPSERWHAPVLRHAADYSAVSLDRRELKPAFTRLGRLVAMTACAAALLFPVVMMTAEFSRSVRRSRPEWATAIFAVPLALVAIGFIVAVVNSFLALFAPRLHLTVTPGACTLGETLALEWKIEGRAGALKRLRIVLKGREEATYQAGKNKRTARSVFRETEVVDTREPGEFVSGGARAKLPHGTMHSLDTGHNRIVWIIRVEGTGGPLSSIKDEYPLAVLPARRAAVS